MNKRLAIALLVAFAATSAYAQSRGHGGGSRGGHGGGGYAVPRGHASGGGHWGGGAVARQPRPGGYYGGGYGHGHGGYYGHGRGYYGHRHYGYYPYYRPYYGYSPYYAYGGWPYAWGYGVGLGIGFYYGNGYGYASYSAPYAQVAYGGSYGRPAPAEAEEPADRGRSRIESATDVGELRLQVGPEDAVVYVDGEFRGIASELVAVRLPPGRHRVEVVRPGYATAEREVHVGRGASASLRIELTPEVERR